MSDPEASADEHYVSIPRGGPIYISDMVGPLTKVADFEVSIFRELEVWSCCSHLDYNDTHCDVHFEACLPLIDSTFIWRHTSVMSLYAELP